MSLSARTCRAGRTRRPRPRLRVQIRRNKLREELTLAKIDHHADAVDGLDVEGILAFAERILPRATDLWVQASLNQKQRLQQCSCPKASPSTEIDSIEPPQRHHFSSAWRRLRVLMKKW